MKLDPTIENGDAARARIREGVLYVWDMLALYVGSNVETEFHRHYAVQFIVSLNEPIRYRCRWEQPWLETEGLMVKSECHHQIGETRSRVAIIFVDPEDDRIFKRSNLGSGSEATMRFVCEPDAKKRLAAVLKRRCSADEAREVVDSFIRSFGETARTQSRDDRIARVCGYIQRHIDQVPLLAVLADLVHLSPDRLMHVFKQETGVPIRRYILWTRLKKAVWLARHGTSLTTAAHGAGFADSAHFSHVFRAMFGIPPSRIFKRLKNA